MLAGIAMLLTLPPTTNWRSSGGTVTPVPEHGNRVGAGRLVADDDRDRAAVVLVRRRAKVMGTALDLPGPITRGEARPAPR